MKSWRIFVFKLERLNWSINDKHICVIIIVIYDVTTLVLTSSKHFSRSSLQSKRHKYMRDIIGYVIGLYFLFEEQFKTRDFFLKFTKKDL